MNLAPLPIQKFFGNNGRPLDGGLLFTYVSGTSTKIATYKDASGASTNTNPIVLDFRGECRLWIDPTKSYTFVLAPSTDTDPPGNPFWTVNDITAAPFAADNAAVDTGSVNNIQLAIPQISSPVAFTRIVFKAANTNTGAVTISINGGTAKALTWQSAVPLTGGEIQANGLYEAIFDGAQWQLQGPTLQPGDIRLYGAIPDGSTDCAAAWALANTRAAAGSHPIYVPRTPAGFAFASQLTVDYRADVVFEAGARLIYTGSSNTAKLVIGDASNVAFSRRYENLWVERQNQSNWSSEADIGIQFRNITGSFISIAQVNGHTIGVQTLPAGGNGFQFNEVYLGQIYNNKFQLDLSNVTNGYTNENNWYGGRLTLFSGVNSSTARYGLRVTSNDATYLTNNNNNFYKPAFELNAPDASAEAICVLMVHGRNNLFRGYRDELNDAPFARESNDSSENYYEAGFSDNAGVPILEYGNAPSSVLRAARTRIMDVARKCFDSGPMHKRWCYYDGAGVSIHVPNVNIAFSGSGATVFTNSTGITPNAAYLDIGGGGGFSGFVNTDVCKQFIVSRQCESGRGGRVVIVCYDTIDGGGSIITTAGSVKGSLVAPFSSTAGYGGGFTTGSDANDDVVVTVSAAVKSIRVIIGAGTATLRIRSFTVYAVNVHAEPGFYVGYEEIAPGQNIGTTPPTTGTWARGRIIWNATPSAAGTPGWVCTTAGTPGTWKAMANVAA